MRKISLMTSGKPDSKRMKVHLNFDRTLDPGTPFPQQSPANAMKLNTKSRVAIKAMLDLATHGAHTPVALASVAQRLKVSLSYLEQLFRQLRGRGFVRSSRGPGGGYQLGKRLSAISVADVVDVVDGETKSRRGSGDSADDLWLRLERNLLDYLRTVTLDSLLAQSRHAIGGPSLHAVTGIPESADGRGLPIAA